MSELPPLDEIEEAFALLPDWTERYRYLIELGKALPEMTDEERTPAHKVDGCMSQVWLVAEDGEGTVRYRADSDAFIVKGLIAILLSMFSDRPAEDIVDTDERATFETLGLTGHLSMGRRNGLESMVRRIKDHARARL
jgi:cysteine desulfuration protein SufE